MGLLSILFGEKEDSKPKQHSTEEKEEYKEKKKQREWADLKEDIKFVCQGGKVLCKYCSEPMADIVVTSTEITLQDKLWATIEDKDGKTNIVFKGTCNHPSQQKPFSPPPPCKAVIQLAEWKGFSDTVVDDNNALLVKSTIQCMISKEDLKIVDSGQKAELNSLAV